MLSLLLLLFSPPPVALGEAGLSLGATLYETADGETWEESGDEIPAIEDLGTGSYLIEGLPDASGEQQYRLAIFDIADPEFELAEIVWGAQQARIAAELTYDRPVNGPVKIDDTAGSIQLVVTSGLTSAIETATATASMKREREIIFQGRAAQIEDAAQVADGSYSARFVFDIQEGDFEKSGRYRVEFVVSYSGGSVETLPKTLGGLQIEAIDRIK